MAIYMKLTVGKLIKGDVTAEGYKDWIGISSWQYGSGRAISMNVGAGANREASVPSLSEMTMSKPMDASSPMLAQKALAGVEAGKAEIDLVRTGDGKTLVIIGKVTLEGVVISSYSISAGEGGAPHESFSISYNKILFDFKGADPQQKNGKEIKFEFDLATNQLN